MISARLVRGRNFYYYEGLERPFGEVRLLHPSHLIKAAERLVRKSEGCEIFAAHIPYEMQFLAAANISGMDMMSLSGSFKRPSVNQLTKCQLEFDIRIEEIDNAKVLWDRWSSGIRDCRATGKFPNSHLLTSLIKMVQEMGIETSTPFDNSSFQALQHQNRIDLIEKYQNQLKKIFLKCDLEKGLMQDQIAKTLTRVYNPVKESLLSLPSQTIPKPILYDVCSDDFVIDEFFLCEESLSPSDMSIPSSDWDFSDDQIIDSESDNFFNPANIKVSESSLNLSSNCEYTECVPESFDELVSENKGITTDNETHGIADEILNYVTTDVDNYAENWEDFSIPQYDGVDDTASESSELNDHELQSNSIYSLNNMWSVKKNVNKESVSAIKSNNFTYKKDVPTTFELFDSLSEYGMEQVTHRRAFISNPSDAGSCPKLPKLDDLITSHRFIEYSKDNTTATLEDSNGWVNKKYYYRFGRDPPLISKDDFLSASYIKPVDSVPQLKKEDLSQIRGPSQVESTRCGELKIFKGFSRNFNLTFLSCELLSQTCLERGQSYEKVRAIYCTHYSAATGHNQHFLYDPCESTMINRLLKLVNELDPDILVGWDLERSSFGIISSRMVDLNLGKFSDRLSRYKSRSKNAEKHQSNLSHPSSQENIKSSGNDFRASASPVNNVVQKKINKSVLWSVNRAFGALRVPGRLSINCWRMMRSELGLSHHDYDHVYSHVFGVHVPLFESKVLNKWFDRTLPGKCGKISSYFFQKCRGNLDLLSTTGVMDRTCEFARMLGVPLVSIISRGSQFRVESLLYRMGRIEGFLLRTPGRRSIKEMRAVEAIPLTMEPSSGVYWDPVVVLDFQSLYPSIAIAYNYCYSTCLGRVDSAYPKDIGCANVNDVSCHTEALCGLLNTDLTNHSISNDDCCESISKNSDLSIKDAQILNFMRDSNDNTSISRDSIRSFAIQEGSFKITDNPQLQKLGIKSLCTSTNSGDKLAPKKSLEKLSEPCSILVSPNRVAFVSSNVREGMLGKIFKELLEARTAIKKLIIEVSENQLESKLTNLERVSMDELNIRQMGLKLAANVIFGYTAASYSGRMPSVDVADSIVQTAREHLLKAKKEIEDHPGWGARVVYGDTDSLFVHLKGRSIREAVAIGRAMADYVTARCPMPVRLRYEKVYSPCVLLAKKRYYGLKYETGLEDEVGCLDARGIETVRRDSCPLVTKILEKSSM